MKSGIYKIVNITNGKFYVGSSKDLSIRWRTHVARLERNYHHNIILQRAWDKYGSDSFLFEILETCSVDQLIEREQYYLDVLSACDRSVGYNISPTAGRTDGMACSDETKQLLRAINLCKTASDDTRKKQSIAATGRTHTEDTINTLSEINKGTNNPMHGKMGKAHHRARPIIQLDLDGNEVARWDSIMDAHRAGFHRPNVISCIKERIATAYGYTWKYATPHVSHRKVYQFNPEGDLIAVHESVGSVINTLGLAPRNNAIYNCLRGAAHSAYGSLWSYEKRKDASTSQIEAKENTHGSRPRRTVKKRQKKKCKTILQYSRDGTFIQEHVSLTAAGKFLEKSHHNISACCKHKTASAYDFIWVFLGDEHTISTKISSLLNPGTKARIVSQYTLDGAFVCNHASLVEARDAVGAKTHANISSCCKGRLKTAYGFVWAYKD